MYRIFVDDELLYSPDRADGGYIVTAAKLTREVNKADSLDLTIPGSNPGLANLRMMGSRITVLRYKNSTTALFDVLFIGRALTAKRGLYDLITYHCEGGLAYFGDISVESTEPFGRSMPRAVFKELYDQISEEYSTTPIGTFIDTYIPNFVQHVYPYNQIYGSEVPAAAKDFKLENTPSMSYMDLSYLEKTLSVQGQYGGTVVLEYSDRKMTEHGNAIYVVIPHYYESGSEPLNSQVIEFGENILDIAQSVDYSSLITVYYAVGFVKVEGRETEQIITLPSTGDGICLVGTQYNNTQNLYIPDTSAVEEYGFLMQSIKYDMTDYHDASLDITYYDAVEHQTKYTQEGTRLRNILLDQLKAHAASNGAANISFQCSAIDRSFVDDSITPLCVGQRNRLISEPNGIDTYIVCSRTEEDLLDPMKNRYTFGTSVSILAHLLRPNTSLVPSTIKIAQGPNS